MPLAEIETNGAIDAEEMAPLVIALAPLVAVAAEATPSPQPTTEDSSDADLRERVRQLLTRQRHPSRSRSPTTMFCNVATSQPGDLRGAGRGTGSE